MDIAPDRDDPKVNRLGTLLATVQAGWGTVGRLLGFFALPRADRLKVGIYRRDGEGDG
jgi:hypothetical protein